MKDERVEVEGEVEEEEEEEIEEIGVCILKKVGGLRHRVVPTFFFFSLCFSSFSF